MPGDAGFNVAGVYTMDATFTTDAAKLLSGNLAALSAMMHLELPHVNVLTKCDLVDPKVYEPLLSVSGEGLVHSLSRSMPAKFKMLNVAIASLLDDYSMVSFVALNPLDEESVEYVLAMVDTSIQYGEDMEPKEPKMDDSDDAEGAFAASATAE
jgi:GPN-loop GTPase